MKFVPLKLTHQSDYPYKFVFDLNDVETRLGSEVDLSNCTVNLNFKCFEQKVVTKQGNISYIFFPTMCPVCSRESTKVKSYLIRKAERIEHGFFSDKYATQDMVLFIPCCCKDRQLRKVIDSNFDSKFDEIYLIVKNRAWAEQFQIQNRVNPENAGLQPENEISEPSLDNDCGITGDVSSDDTLTNYSEDESENNNALSKMSQNDNYDNLAQNDFVSVEEKENDELEKETDDVEQELLRLKGYHDKGLISDEEYSASKQTALSRLRQKDGPKKNHDDVDSSNSNSETLSNNPTNTADWFTVKVLKQQGIRIPNMCPITLSRDCEFTKKVSVKHVDSTNMSMYRISTKTSRFELPFPIKDERTAELFDSFVKIHMTAFEVCFSFKNQVYAEVFSQYNDAPIIAQSESERRFRKIRSMFS